MDKSQTSHKVVQLALKFVFFWVYHNAKELCSIGGKYDVQIKDLIRTREIC